MQDSKATSEHLSLVLDELGRLPLCKSILGCNAAGLTAMAELGRLESFPADVVVLTAGEPARGRRPFVPAASRASSTHHD
jgi:hypothetical protein